MSMSHKLAQYRAERIEELEAALRDIAEGNAEVPDDLLSSMEPSDVAQYMWSWSQKTARAALKVTP